MAVNDKKIATEAEFYEILKPFDTVPSELSNGICLRKGRIPKYTEKTFDSLNDYKDDQLVPLATFIDVANADYVLFSFEWEGDGDLDCIVKTSNFDEDYIGIGYGTHPLYGGYDKNANYRPNEIIQWSGDVTKSGGEYFLIDMKKLKEYKTKYGLANKYFDFDVYAHWYTPPTDISKKITLKVESIIAKNVQKVSQKRFEFTNENITKTLEYKFDTKAYLSLSAGNAFFYDLVKQIRCFGTSAMFLPIKFPKIKILENLTKPPILIVNGENKTTLFSTIGNTYNIYKVKTGDKIKITLYPYSFKKITIDENGNEHSLYNNIEIKEIGPFNKPSSDILTCDYHIADDRTEMTIDINVIDFSPEKITNNYVSISFDFLGENIRVDLNIN